MSPQLNDQDWLALNARLHGFIAKRVANPDDVDEILQDSYQRMQNNLGQLHDQDRFESWLYQIVRNRIIDFYRKRKLNVGELEDLSADEPTEDFTKELSPCLEKMIRHLDPADQEALEHVHIKQLSIQDYASTCNLGISAAKSRVQRARRKMRDLFEECCSITYNAHGSVSDIHQKECKHCEPDVACGDA